MIAHETRQANGGFGKQVILKQRLADQEHSSEARDKTDLSGVIDAILQVGGQRKLLLDQMRSALESDDNETALRFARQLCGLMNEKSTRIN